MATMTPSRPPVLLNLPNQLTLARFVLALVLFWLIDSELETKWLWCLAVFVVAAITDWLDGYLARLQNITSTLGRHLDPMVDKILTCGAFVFLLPAGTHGGWLVPWMVTLVVSRELVITGLRSFMESHGADFGADWLGKLKMGLQCAALIAVFVVMESGRWLSDEWVRYLSWLRDFLMYTMLVATLLSGLQYLWRATVQLRANSE